MKSAQLLFFCWSFWLPQASSKLHVKRRSLESCRYKNTTDKVGITPFKLRLLRFNNGSFSNHFERLWIKPHWSQNHYVLLKICFKEGFLARFEHLMRQIWKKPHMNSKSVSLAAFYLPKSLGKLVLGDGSYWGSLIIWLCYSQMIKLYQDRDWHYT